MITLTIFTPTYNREKELLAAYESLKNQTTKKFVWLVVDDGSTDNTEKLVKQWKKEADFEIVYKKKKNGGKHTAYNYALDCIKTKYVFVALDSDDYIFNNNTIEKILKELNKLGDEIGLVTLCSNRRKGNNDLVKTYEIDKLEGKSLTYAYENNLFNAEGSMVFLTEYLRNFRYPEIEGERFFTEAYTYYQMDKPIKWTNIISCYREYLEGGLTMNTKKLFVNSPNSWYLYNELRMKNNKKISRKIKYAIYYIAFAILAKQRIFKHGLKNIFLILLYPVGFVGAKYLKMKG